MAEKSISYIDIFFSVGWSKSQLIAFLIIPKITGTASAIGSGYIVQDVLRNPPKRKSTYHRVMLGLSCADIFYSIAWILGSWPMPKGTQLFAAGNVTTCDIFGFIQLVGGLASVMYNCSLTTYYFLQLNCNLVDRKMKNVEKWLHIVPWSVAFVPGIVGLILQGYGPHYNTCWYVSSYQ